MKNNIIILAVLLVTASCNKELGALPENAKVDGNTIINEQTARIALNGVYYQLANVDASDNVTNWGMQQRFPEMFSGYLGYGYGQLQEEINIYSNAGDYFWQFAYKIINAANGVITRVEALPDNYFTGNSKNEILGEAKFLRAYANARLLTYYAEWFDLSSSLGILIRDELVDLKNAQKARSNVADSYSFVFEDLDFAIANAPDETENVYASKYAAMALKMRVLMLHGQPGDYAEAITLADNIIDNGGYSLEANPKEIFYIKGLSSTEVILGIKPQQNQEKYYYNTSKQYYPGASALYAATSGLAELVAGDPRESWYIGPATPVFPGTFYFTKYIDDGTSPTTVSETAYPFRLTEVYLLKAEAIIRSGGDVDDAKTIIKDIMSRAGITDFDVIDNAADSDALLVELYKEIARNFVGEDGQSWAALLRLPEATVKQLRPTITNKLQYILPVPRAEFLNNQSFGEQNTGYQKF